MYRASRHRSTRLTSPSARQKQLPNEHIFDTAPKRRGLLATIESKLGMATSSADLTVESGKVSGDRQHYWYIEDSEDQSKWRNKDAHKSSTATASSASATATKGRRDIVDALAHVGDELDAAGVMSSPSSTSTAGFVTSTRPAAASSTAPTPSSTAPAAAAPTSTASGNSTDISWTDPSSGPGISSEITGEYNDLKTRLKNLSILSKIGLATLVIVSTIALGFLLYCCCKLNQRRRRRNAAERVNAKLQAQHVATGGRNFDDRSTGAYSFYTVLPHARRARNSRRRCTRSHPDARLRLGVDVCFGVAGQEGQAPPQLVRPSVSASARVLCEGARRSQEAAKRQQWRR